MYSLKAFRFFIGNSMNSKIPYLLTVLILFTGCASSNSDQSDPLESFNRSMFAVNQGLDKAIRNQRLRSMVSPQPVKTGVGNVLSNLSLPVTFINQTLQGNIDSAGNTLVRFSVNSTIGLIGIFDVATGLGVKQEKEDFGQTLAVYGVGSGPYIFLPILAPAIRVT